MDDQRMDDERARAVWLRAAQLQAEAAQRLEERSRVLAAQGETSHGDGLSREVVRAAAVEAGIAPEFVDLALAESDGSLEPGKELVGWKDRSATRYLGSDQRRLDVTRILNAPPERVLEAMQQVLPNHPYLLSLRDTVGDDPLNGAVLVFEVPGITGASYTTFSYRMAWSDLKELRFVLRPVEEGARTEVLVTVPLAHSRRMSWIVGNSLSGVFGAFGGLLGIGAAKALVLTGAVVAAPIAAGTLGLAGLSSMGIRAAYRYGLRKATEEITTLLKKVEVTCRMGTAFTPAQPRPASGGPDQIDHLLG